MTCWRYWIMHRCLSVCDADFKLPKSNNYKEGVVKDVCQDLFRRKNVVSIRIQENLNSFYDIINDIDRQQYNLSADIELNELNHCCSADEEEVIVKETRDTTVPLIEIDQKCYGDYVRNNEKGITEAIKQKAFNGKILYRLKYESVPSKVLLDIYEKEENIIRTVFGSCYVDLYSMVELMAIDEKTFVDIRLERMSLSKSWYFLINPTILWMYLEDVKNVSEFEFNNCNRRHGDYHLAILKYVSCKHLYTFSVRNKSDNPFGGDIFEHRFIQATKPESMVKKHSSSVIILSYF